MNESLILVLAWLAGAALGALFFGGLWWTIRRAVASPQPAIWFLGSLVVRMAAVLAGVYFVSGGAWPRALACLLGFVMARQLLLRASRAPAEVSP
jgi:F1F0 ATPase subunit 2